MAGLTIGKVAERAGVKIDTLRYYERQGLIEPPDRNGSNYRVYEEDAILRVRFVKRAQELGFTLAEIKELLGLRADGDASCADVRDRARLKLRSIDAKIRALQAMREALSDLVRECSGRGPVADCPILEAFEPKEER